MAERSSRFHVGLTSEAIADAALELTRETHLSAWSMRDLARRLEVAPSVVYHHVGGKDLVSRLVVERVLARIVAPDPELDWQDWFRALLLPAREIVAPYRGVAKWLIMHGPVFPTILPMVDAGVRTLQRSGFGEQAGLAYATLLNNAMLTVSISDDRLAHDEDGPRDHDAMLRDFQRAGAGSPGVAALVDSLIRPYTRGDESAERARTEYFRYVVETTIAGVAALRES